MHKQGYHLHTFYKYFLFWHPASTLLSFVYCNLVSYGNPSLPLFSTSTLLVVLQNQVPEWNMWLKAKLIITVPWPQWLVLRATEMQWECWEPWKKKKIMSFFSHLHIRYLNVWRYDSYLQLQGKSLCENRTNVEVNGTKWMVVMEKLGSNEVVWAPDRVAPETKTNPWIFHFTGLINYLFSLPT